MVVLNCYFIPDSTCLLMTTKIIYLGQIKNHSKNVGAKDFLPLLHLVKNDGFLPLLLVLPCILDDLLLILLSILYGICLKRCF